MDARITKEETALLLSLGTHATNPAVEDVRLAALRARDEAIGTAVKHAFMAVFRGVGAAFAFLAAYPERTRTLRQLASLTDRELADIGLERGDLGRVFDADFEVPGRTEKPQLRATTALAA
jgi:uncharacterized protein YjiS (DUF1127 family)